MKKATFLLLVICFSDSLSAQEVNTSSDLSSQDAKIYFIRSTGFSGSAVAFTVFIDDSIVCRLNNKRYSIHPVAPGVHQFSVQFAGKKSKEKAERIEIKTEPAKEYYIQLIFQGGAFTNNLYCQEVTASSAQPILGKIKQDSNCQ